MGRLCFLKIIFKTYDWPLNHYKYCLVKCTLLCSNVHITKISINKCITKILSTIYPNGDILEIKRSLRENFGVYRFTKISSFFSLYTHLFFSSKNMHKNNPISYLFFAYFLWKGYKPRLPTMQKADRKVLRL